MGYVFSTSQLHRYQTHGCVTINLKDLGVRDGPYSMTGPVNVSLGALNKISPVTCAWTMRDGRMNPRSKVVLASRHAKNLSLARTIAAAPASDLELAAKDIYYESRSGMTYSLSFK